MRCPSMCNRTDVEDFFTMNLDEISYSQDNCTESEDSELYTLVPNYYVGCPFKDNSTFDYNFTFQNYTAYFKANYIANCTYDGNGELKFVNTSYNGTDKLTTNQSICGLDGYSYCKPSKSSKIFSKYWSVCDMSSNNSIDMKTMKLWESYKERFIEITTAPYCAEDLFKDISIPNLDFIIDAFSVFFSIQLTLLFI